MTKLSTTGGNTAPLRKLQPYISEQDRQRLDVLSQAEELPSAILVSWLIHDSLCRIAQGDRSALQQIPTPARGYALCQWAEEYGMDDEIFMHYVYANKRTSNMPTLAGHTAFLKQQVAKNAAYRLDSTNALVCSRLMLMKKWLEERRLVDFPDRKAILTALAKEAAQVHQ